jgi:hypothetical protein
MGNDLKAMAGAWRVYGSYFIVITTTLEDYLSGLSQGLAGMAANVSCAACNMNIFHK